MFATAALSVTSVVTAMALTPCWRNSAMAASDFASLRAATAISAPAAASPRAMPRPMPPLPPVTIATLPLRSNSFVIGVSPIFRRFISTPYLTLALPDQDQAEAGERRAIAGPLQLADHEARRRPFHHAGALADPEQADGQREEADDQQQLAHGLCPSLAAARQSALAPMRDKA